MCKFMLVDPGHFYSSVVSLIDPGIELVSILAS